MDDASQTLSPDQIADCVLNAFDRLPRKFKPRILDDARCEWVPLAGIVLTKDHDSITCAALATGMKCLPQNKIGLAKGNVIHDWHAEVLVKRAFNRWLIDECAELAGQGSNAESPWIRWRPEGLEPSVSSVKTILRNESSPYNSQPFALKDGVSLHMYCSEAPCGDASQELVMAEQDDPTPWTREPSISNGSAETQQMLGRGNFAQVGIVRRKPSRPDAPICLSKSCSDKLALSQLTGILSGPTTLLVHPRNAYISRLLLPQSQYIKEAIDRAFSANGRLSRLKGREWGVSGYAFRPFTVQTTTREFAFSRRSGGKQAPAPSNLAALYTPHRQEVLVNGVLQGRKQFDFRGASCVSRRLLWKRILEVAMMANLPALATIVKQKTYLDLKATKSLCTREQVKGYAREVALQNWLKNAGDDLWELDDEW